MRTTMERGIVSELSPIEYSIRQLRSRAESAWMRQPFFSTMVSAPQAVHKTRPRQNVIIDFN